jgi:hypothetical protein
LASSNNNPAIPEGDGYPREQNLIDEIVPPTNGAEHDVKDTHDYYGGIIDRLNPGIGAERKWWSRQFGQWRYSRRHLGLEHERDAERSEPAEPAKFTGGCKQRCGEKGGHRRHDRPH